LPISPTERSSKRKRREWHCINCGYVFEARSAEGMSGLQTSQAFTKFWLKISNDLISA